MSYLSLSFYALLHSLHLRADQAAVNAVKKSLLEAIEKVSTQVHVCAQSAITLGI